MEDICPVTPLRISPGRDSKSPVHLRSSSPDSDSIKSPNGRTSPDSRCVICLGHLQNKCFTDSCFHHFCFQCLVQWSKVKAVCPLCKQSFKSIIHNVRSNLDYDEYHIDPPEALVISNVFSYNFDLIPVDRRFRYRSTMTREYYREIAEGWVARPTFSVGVEQLPNISTVNSRYGRIEKTSMDFRRYIYFRDLWVEDTRDATGRYRECTPEFYKDNSAQVFRLMPWLTRELNALLCESPTCVTTLLERIIRLLPKHSIRSRKLRELVAPYLTRRTDHFIHEFHAFARCIYDMSWYDTHATYRPNRSLATEVQEISSPSGEDSDVEVISTIKAPPTTGYKYLLRRAKASASEPVAGPSGVGTTYPNPHARRPTTESDGEVVFLGTKTEPDLIVLSSEEETAKCHTRSTASSSRDSSPALKWTSKGKCKSNGAGLKGKQKRKYMGSVSTEAVSTSTETKETVSSSDSSSCEPLSKLRQRRTKKKRKSKKKRSSKRKASDDERDRSRKKPRRVRYSDSEEGTYSKVRSCVVVPKKESWNRDRYDSSSTEEDEYSKPGRFVSYWSNHLNKQTTSSQDSSSSTRRPPLYPDSNEESGHSSKNSCSTSCTHESHSSSASND